MSMNGKSNKLHPQSFWVHPCPICKGEDQDEGKMACCEENSPGGFQVWCTTCGLSAPVTPNIAEAVNNWQVLVACVEDGRGRHWDKVVNRGEGEVGPE